MTPEAVVAMTTYTVGEEGCRLTFTDTGELIVHWPKPIAPPTHPDAAAEALRLSREVAR